MIDIFALCLLLAQSKEPPNLTGIWKLEPEASRMVGAGGRVGSGPTTRQISWIIAHHEPRISVTVNVRDSAASHEFSFGCTTDGKECVNELPQLKEVRRMTALWAGDTLRMRVKAQTPHGSFEADDRLHVVDNGQTLIFDRVVKDGRGERVVKQVLRKQQPLSPQPPVPPLPSVSLPAELDRVLRDYERFWRTGNASALSELFTTDGFIARRGGWIRGREAIRAAYQGPGSDLRLRAVAYAVDARVGYIVGSYGYGENAARTDTGRFILALRRDADNAAWLIAADLDGANRP